MAPRLQPRSQRLWLRAPPERPHPLGMPIIWSMKSSGSGRKIKRPFAAPNQFRSKETSVSTHPVVAKSRPEWSTDGGVAAPVHVKKSTAEITPLPFQPKKLKSEATKEPEKKEAPAKSTIWPKEGFPAAQGFSFPCRTSTQASGCP